jgi:hypothetical protein
MTVSDAKGAKDSLQMSGLAIIITIVLCKEEGAVQLSNRRK